MFVYCKVDTIIISSNVMRSNLDIFNHNLSLTKYLLSRCVYDSCTRQGVLNKILSITCGRWFAPSVKLLQKYNLNVVGSDADQT